MCNDAALRISRRLHRMHVQVQRAGVFGIARDHRFQHPHDFGGMALGPQRLVVVIPWLQVHERLGMQHCGVKVIRAQLYQRAG
jgi:hypothetical protein